MHTAAAANVRGSKRHDRIDHVHRGRWTIERAGFAGGVTGLVVIAAIGVSVVAATALASPYVAGALLGAGLVSTIWVFPSAARWMDARRARRVISRTPARRVVRLCRRAPWSPVPAPPPAPHPPSEWQRRVRVCKGSRHA